MSKQTEKVRAEIIVMRGEIEKLTKPMAACLTDDKGDVERLGERLSTLRAKEDILRARIARRQAELADLVRVDAAAALEDATRTAAAAADELKRAKATWRDEVTRNYGRGEAEAILKDEAFRPVLVRNATRALEEATAARSAADNVLQDIDPAHFAQSNPHRLKPDYYRLNPTQRPPDFAANIARLVPELAG